MVRAILAGTKTQTRRVCRAQHDNVWVEDGVMYGYHDAGNDGRVPSAYGVAGDTLWVRETFANIAIKGYDPTYFYRADGDELPPRDARAADNRWRPSIFMPRAASRIDLRVTAVRVERLQDISEEDAIAEGVELELVHRSGGAVAFRDLWDSLNATRAPWASNPWVWVITFERAA
jgi:hypothetical protein